MKLRFIPVSDFKDKSFYLQINKDKSKYIKTFVFDIKNNHIFASSTFPP